jgi:serine protease
MEGLSIMFRVMISWHTTRSWLFACLVLLSIVFVNAIQAATIRVPQDAPTIQEGINSAVNGDTVLVAPGTYFERIAFHGKAITVQSEQGPAVTIIDGRHNFGSVVTFQFGETPASRLSGFTIQNGRASFGAGIFIQGVSPQIDNNIIAHNEADAGAGILMTGSSAVIEGNDILDNRTVNSTGFGGGGILIHEARGARISRNRILRNSVTADRGGGVSLSGPNTVTFLDNLVSGNSASFGGGIFIDGAVTEAQIIQNLIVGNSASSAGGGIAWSLSGSRLINNTIADNDGSGLALDFAPFVGDALIANNIIIAKQNQVSVDCFSSSTAPVLILRFNNVFSPQGFAYGSRCDPSQIETGISADPQFVNPSAGDFRLMLGSPSIDSGTNDVHGLPPTDFNGGPRIVDADGIDGAVIDMGAYEYNNIPVPNAGPDQTIACGANCQATVVLDGRGSSDPDGDSLNFVWTGPFGTVSGATASVSLPRGEHTITLTVSDPSGNTASDTVVIRVVDATPPNISAATVTPDILLQANHQMVPITVSAAVLDNCDPAVVCRIISIASNEPIEGLGDGDTSPDWVITGSLSLDVRAERSGKGNSRVYTITIECSDSSGNSSTKTVTVTVPRNN